ncbi:DUF1971 domain-containing protein [Hyphococcus sp.]|uniref:DUF1971 domain-containing protein n=1 Tax=Hyphococcus sp. TaxID=2038636 RepID=UPI003CCB8F9E
MRDAMPDGLIKYGGTPEFNEKTVPAKLTLAHDTKPGVWGKLIVKDGALDYVVPGPPKETRRLASGAFGVIEPAVKHYVSLNGAVTFRVDFYRAARSE